MILLIALLVAIWFAGFMAIVGAATASLEHLGFGVALTGTISAGILYIGLTLQILSWTGVIWFNA